MAARAGTADQFAGGCRNPWRTSLGRAFSPAGTIGLGYKVEKTQLWQNNKKPNAGASYDMRGNVGGNGCQGIGRLPSITRRVRLPDPRGPTASDGGRGVRGWDLPRDGMGPGLTRVYFACISGGCDFPDILTSVFELVRLRNVRSLGKFGVKTGTLSVVNFVWCGWFVLAATALRGRPGRPPNGSYSWYPGSENLDLPQVEGIAGIG